MLSRDHEDPATEVKPGLRKADGTVVLTFALSFLIFSGWLGGIFLAPYLRSVSSPWAGLVYSVYSPFCHQVPERSLSCFGYPLSVCARCSGIYAGMFVGFILYPFIRGWRRVRMPESRLFLMLSVPIVLDAGANVIGLWHSSPAVRLSTGLLWGAILPFYLITGGVDFLSRRQEKTREKSRRHGEITA